MKYLRTLKYNTELINQKIMGPNPLKLEEELMEGNSIKSGSIVMDLGSRTRNYISISCKRIWI